MGIVLIIMGLLITLYFHSVYRFGSDAQMVNTKWDTIRVSPIPPNSPMNQVLEVAGLGLAVSGLIPLIKGIKRISDFEQGVASSRRPSARDRTQTLENPAKVPFLSLGGHFPA